MATPAGGAGGPEKASWFKFSLFTPMIKPSAMSMPSKGDVLTKLSSFGKGSAKMMGTLGRALKKGSGQTVLFGGTLVGSKLGGDAAVRKGAKWAGKTREADKGVASYRRGQIGAGIKKKWGKALESLGKSLYEKAYDASLSPKVATGSKTYRFLSSVEDKGRRMQMSGGITASKANSKQVIEKRMRGERALSRADKTARRQLRTVEMYLRAAEQAMGFVEDKLDSQNKQLVKSLVSQINEVAAKNPEKAIEHARDLADLLISVDNHDQFVGKSEEFFQLERTMTEYLHGSEDLR